MPRLNPVSVCKARVTVAVKRCRERIQVDCAVCGPYGFEAKLLPHNVITVFSSGLVAPL